MVDFTKKALRSCDGQKSEWKLENTLEILILQLFVRPYHTKPHCLNF